MSRTTESASFCQSTTFVKEACRGGRPWTVFSLQTPKDPCVPYPQPLRVRRPSDLPCCPSSLQRSLSDCCGKHTKYPQPQMAEITNARGLVQNAQDYNEVLPCPSPGSMFVARTSKPGFIRPDSLDQFISSIPGTIRSCKDVGGAVGPRVFVPPPEGRMYDMTQCDFHDCKISALYVPIESRIYFAYGLQLPGKFPRAWHARHRSLRSQCNTDSCRLALHINGGGGGTHSGVHCSEHCPSRGRQKG